MSQRMRIPSRVITPSTGDPVGSQATASDPAYSWKKLLSEPGEDTELSVLRSVSTHDGADVLHAGGRNDSYDLEITSPLERPDWADPFLAMAGLRPGKYEVKSLWRSSDKRSFDRRFKVGRRGERIYGRRDAEIKSFASGLEDEIDAIIQNSVDDGPRGQRSPDSMRRFVEETHAFINDAFERRHSKAFVERITRLARASMEIPTLTLRAHTVLKGGVQGLDIVKGFDNIEGIFIVAGPMYTLINRNEIPEFIKFDSASSEGPKLSYVGAIPTEPVRLRVREKGDGKVVPRTSPNKGRKANKNL